KRLIVETVSVEAIAVANAGEDTPAASGAPEVRPLSRVRARMAGREWDTAVYDRNVLTPGATLDGPAIIKETNATTVLEPGWRSSVNIKERLDFSCALFDVDGALIANAPHIPVHLGSMGDSVRTIIHAHSDA